MNYQEDIEINKDMLDVEWGKQSSLYLKYSKEYANALYQKEKAKESLDVTSAKVFLEIKTSYEEYGLEKQPSDKMTNEVLLLDERVQTAKNILLEKSYEVNILLSAKNAFEHKKTALEMLSKLYLSGYWSTPQISSEHKDKKEKELRKTLEQKTSTNKRMAKLKRRKL